MTTVVEVSPRLGYGYARLYTHSAPLVLKMPKSMQNVGGILLDLARLENRVYRDLVVSLGLKMAKSTQNVRGIWRGTK